MKTKHFLLEPNSDFSSSLPVSSICRLWLLAYLCMSIVCTCAYLNADDWLSPCLPLAKGSALYLSTNTESMAWGEDEGCFPEVFNRALQGKKSFRWRHRTLKHSDKQTVLQTDDIKRYPYVVSSIYGGYLLYKIGSNLLAAFSNWAPQYTYTHALWVGSMEKHITSDESCALTWDVHADCMGNPRHYTVLLKVD